MIHHGIVAYVSASRHVMSDSVDFRADQLDRLNNLTPAAGERHGEANMASIDR